MSPNYVKPNYEPVSQIELVVISDSTVRSNGNLEVNSVETISPTLKT